VSVHPDVLPIATAVLAGMRLSAADRGFVRAFVDGAPTYTPDETTRPYDADGIRDAVAEIADDAQAWLAVHATTHTTSQES